MSESYKLVFRGEVLEGQHPAVVRKRLGESGGFAEEALDKLFSGRPVIVKREADTATAARFQALFRKAGARLRVLPVETGDDPLSTGPAAAAGPGTASAPASEAAPGRSASSDDGFELLPAGSDILRDDERSGFETREIDTGGLALEGARFVVDEAAPDAPSPDVSHLSVAEAGADLGGGAAVQAPADVPVPSFEIAEPGADLSPRRAPDIPPIDPATVTFEVAPAGSDLGERKSSAPAAAPDVSHLSLEPESGR